MPRWVCLQRLFALQHGNAASGVPIWLVHIDTRKKRHMTFSAAIKTAGVLLNTIPETENVKMSTQSSGLLQRKREKKTLRLSSLSEDEKVSIQKYTYNGTEPPKLYQRINAMLRGEIPEEETLRYHTECISGALKHSVIGENILYYRGTSINPIPGVEPGTVVSLNQFISTSATESKAFNQEVSITIYTPKGTAGAAYIEELSKYPKQREILFDKDCNYVVLSNKDKKSNWW